MIGPISNRHRLGSRSSHPVRGRLRRRGSDLEASFDCLGCSPANVPDYWTLSSSVLSYTLPEQYDANVSGGECVEGTVFGQPAVISNDRYSYTISRTLPDVSDFGQAEILELEDIAAPDDYSQCFWGVANGVIYGVRRYECSYIPFGTCNLPVKDAQEYGAVAVSKYIETTSPNRTDHTYIPNALDLVEPADCYTQNVCNPGGPTYSTVFCHRSIGEMLFFGYRVSLQVDAGDLLLRLEIFKRLRHDSIVESAVGGDVGPGFEYGPSNGGYPTRDADFWPLYRDAFTGFPTNYPGQGPLSLYGTRYTWRGTYYCDSQPATLALETSLVQNPYGVVLPNAVTVTPGWL